MNRVENNKLIILLIVNILYYPVSNEFTLCKRCAFFAKLCVIAISQRATKKPQRITSHAKRHILDYYIIFRVSSKHQILRFKN